MLHRLDASAFTVPELLALRGALALDLAYAEDDADAALDRYESGEGDFGDRCYWGDLAYDAAWNLFRFDAGAAALILALEA